MLYFLNSNARLSLHVVYYVICNALLTFQSCCLWCALHNSWSNITLTETTPAELIFIQLIYCAIQNI